MNPGPRDDDRSIDERFADIVAHWDALPPPDRDGPRRDAATPGDRPPDAAGEGGVPDPGAPADRPEAGPGTPMAGPEEAAAPGDGGSTAAPRRPLPPPPTSGWRVHTPPEDEDEGYVPPPPAPLPRHDWMFWGALVGLVAGPVWLVYLVAVERAVNRTPMWIAGGLIVAGFGLLIARLPARRAPDDDDDGARV